MVVQLSELSDVFERHDGRYRKSNALDGWLANCPWCLSDAHNTLSIDFRDANNCQLAGLDWGFRLCRESQFKRLGLSRDVEVCHGHAFGKARDRQFDLAFEFAEPLNLNLHAWFFFELLLRFIAIGSSGDRDGVADESDSEIGFGILLDFDAVHK